MFGFDLVENEIAAEHKPPETEMLVAPYERVSERSMFQLFGLLSELTDERDSTAWTISGNVVANAQEIIAHRERT